MTTTTIPTYVMASWPGVSFKGKQLTRLSSMLVFLTRFWTYANSPARSGRRRGWIGAGAEAGGKSHTGREGAASGLGLIGMAVATAWFWVATASRSAVEAEAEAEGEAAFGEPTEEGKMKSSRFMASAQAEPASTGSGPLTVLGGVVAALERAGAAGIVAGAPSDDVDEGKDDGRSCHDGGRFLILRVTRSRSASRPPRIPRSFVAAPEASKAAGFPVRGGGEGKKARCDLAGRTTGSAAGKRQRRPPPPPPPPPPRPRASNVPFQLPLQVHGHHAPREVLHPFLVGQVRLRPLVELPYLREQGILLVHLLGILRLRGAADIVSPDGKDGLTKELGASSDGGRASIQDGVFAEAVAHEGDGRRTDDVAGSESGVLSSNKSGRGGLVSRDS